MNIRKISSPRLIVTASIKDEGYSKPEQIYRNIHNCTKQKVGSQEGCCNEKI